MEKKILALSSLFCLASFSFLAYTVYGNRSLYQLIDKTRWNSGEQIVKLEQSFKKLKNSTRQVAATNQEISTAETSDTVSGEPKAATRSKMDPIKLLKTCKNSIVQI